MVTLQEIRKYDFNDGTTIRVKIDFEHNLVSFVDSPYDKVSNEYEPKKWLFANRGLEYMNGWHNILACMQYVVDDVKKELEKYEASKKQAAIELAVLILESEKKK